jgi:serine/threonine protein kinase
MGADPAAEEQFGPYAVYERLGVGGMATVHRALERGPDGFERMVALKRLLPHLAEDASFIKSFVREAKLASILNHINIVQIYELGRVGSEYFISMEYIDGRDVRRILRHARKVTGPPPIHVTVALLIQLCEALDYAHNKVDENGEPLKLVHRDVSPSNVIVTSSGHLKVIDFGIAKAESSQLRTQTGRVKGKLAYMAPEAIAGGRDLDARSDLWAVGVILHELLTARPLFASKNEYQTLLKVQKGEIMPPSTFNQACPPELDAIVFKALARNPDDRFSSAAEMRAELLEIKKQYALQTGYRDVAAWLDWAFSLEQTPDAFTNQPTTGVSEVDPVEKQVRAKTPRPARNADEDEAVAMVWGNGEGEGSGSAPLLLDEVPDVSAPRRADTAYDDIPDAQPSHGAHGVHADSLLTLASPQPMPPPDPAIARGTDPPVARGSNQMQSPTPSGSQPKPRPARPTGTINVPKPAGTGPVGRTTAQGIPAQRAPAPRPASPSAAPTRASDRVPAQDGPEPARATSPAQPTRATSPAQPARATSPTQQARAASPQPASRPPGTRQTGPSPTVPPARQTGPSSTVAPARQTGSSPTVPPARQTGSSPTVPPARQTGSSPTVRPAGSRASDRLPAEPQRTSGQAPAIEIPQFDGTTNESLTTTTPEGFALPAIDSSALRAEDLFGDDDNDLAAADNAATMARPQERKPTEFDVTMNPVATPVPDDVLPSVPVVRFSKQVTAPPPVEGTRTTGTVSAVTSQGIGVPVPPRTLTGQLRAPTVNQTGELRAKSPSQAPPGRATVKQSNKRVWLFSAIGVFVAGAAGAAIILMSKPRGGESAHVTAPTTAPTAPEITTGTVKVVTEPADSEIKIEDLPPHAGSPWAIDLPAGIHQIEIHHAGYKAWLTSIELSARETQTLRVVLEPITAAAANADATLTISTNPPGLEALLDGNPLAEKTPTKITIKVGPHTIAVRQNGAEVWHQSFTAEASSDYEFNPSFTADKQRERALRAAHPTPKPSPPADVAPETLESPAPTGAGSGSAAAPPPPASPTAAAPPPSAAPPAATAPPTAAAPPSPPPAAPSPAPAKPLAPAGPVLVLQNQVTRVSGGEPDIAAFKNTSVPPTISAKVCIDPAGHVTTVNVLTKLDRQAASDLADAVKAWAYAPYKKDGTAVAACFVLAMRVR